MSHLETEHFVFELVLAPSLIHSELNKYLLRRMNERRKKCLTPSTQEVVSLASHSASFTGSHAFP